MTDRGATLRAAALAIVLVGSGVVVGVVIERFWLADAPTAVSGARAMPPPPAGPEFVDRIFEKFRSRLKLDEEQSVKVRAVLEEMDKAAREVHAQVGPVMRAAMDKADEDIRAVLDEEQRAEYQRILDERDRRFSRMRHGPPRHGPPHDHEDRRKHFEKVDTSGDDKLSREELEAAGRFGERILRRFDEIDSDGDGLLSHQELRDGRPRGPRP